MRRLSKKRPDKNGQSQVARREEKRGQRTHIEEDDTSEQVQPIRRQQRNDNVSVRHVLFVSEACLGAGERRENVPEDGIGENVTQTETTTIGLNLCFGILDSFDGNDDSGGLRTGSRRVRLTNLDVS